MSNEGIMSGIRPRQNYAETGAVKDYYGDAEKIITERIGDNKSKMDPLTMLFRLRSQQVGSCRFLWQVNQDESFFENYDLLLCPAAAVPPFDGRMRYPTEIDGVKLERYIDWLMICGVITLTGCSAASIPCGFTKTNKPVGLQIVAPPRSEAEVISAGSLFEQAHPYASMLPIDPKTPGS